MSLPTIAFAASTLVLASAAGAQDIDYETGQYEYAQPAPELDNDVVTQTIAVEEDSPPAPAARVIPMRQPVATPVFVGNEVVQSTGEMVATISDPVIIEREYEPVPAQRVIMPRAQPMAQAPVLVTFPAQPAYVAGPGSAPVLYAYPPAQLPAHGAGSARVIYPQPQAMQQQQVVYGQAYQPGYAYVQPAAPSYLPAGAQLVQFDRTAWLEECRARLDTHDDSDRGQVIGALVGAAAGGIIGNRVAGSGNRTAGTLIGAGAGAVAGLAAGDAIDDRNDARILDSHGHCEAYLDDYMRDAQASAGQVSYTQGGQYMLVPVTVAVPQAAVYSDGTPVR